MESIENSLQSEIDELQELCQRMEDMKINESRFDPPATEEEILGWESNYGITIPESYKEWLRFSNGAQIFGFTAQFYSIKGIVVEEKYLPEDLVMIGDMIGDGELICFSKETGKIFSLFEGKREDYGSFKEVLIEVIRIGKGQLGEDESSRAIVAKLMAMLEAQRKEENK
jgi:AAA+ ATPase superfamily predicted ATPase